MESLGEFVPDALCEAAAGEPLAPLTGRLNQVLRTACSGAYCLMHMPGHGVGLALPGLTPRPANPAPGFGARNFPRLRNRVVGREDVTGYLVANVPRARLVTLVGAGGIGKTTSAVDAGNRLQGGYGDGACFVDLSYLASGERVPSAVSAALQMPEPGNMGVPELVAFLRDRQMLLVLDNCEHVVAAVASLCEGVFKSAPRCHVIVTSREPLRCRGEAVLRMKSLPAPAKNAARSASQALGYAAVELFTERLADRRPGYALHDDDAERVAAICRQVDGLPLALELVAALTDRYGLEPMSRRLAESPLSLRNERQPLAPRHQSLETLFAWSHELLSPLERRTFEELSIFRSSFSLASAAAVASAGQAGLAAISDAVVALAQKSLVVLEPSEDGPLCRYLETTRAFAFQKLKDSCAAATVAGGHAHHLCALFHVAGKKSLTIERAAWLRLYGPLINDVRAALDWAFAPGGEPLVGVELTVASATLAPQLSLWDEYWAHHERAAGYIDSTGAHPAPQVELPLRNAFALFIGQNRGPVAEMMRNYDASVELARQLDEPAFTALALDGAWMGAFLSGDYPGALALVHRCRAGTGEGFEQPGQIRTARMLSQTLHAMAQHDAAREVAEQLLVGTAGVRRVSESAIDPQVSGRAVLARLHWLQGRPDEAAEVIGEALRRAEDDTSVSLAHAISWGALPVALWRGDIDLAQRLLRRLAEHCTAFHLPYWGSWALTYQSAIAGALEPGATASGNETDFKRLDMLVTVAPFAVTPQAVARAEAGQAPWCGAEVLRADGDQLLRAGCATQAEARFEQALALAHAQQAPAWALRALTSLVQLGGPYVAARRDRLAAAHGRFHEGLDTRDLRAAREVLGAPLPEAAPAFSA
ncbi:ATP-binding protein [Variovorax sp. LT1R16]|uniref:ATP-binding protein n=1 Tax=Variovorax sp. LT1R16 TaxID=3443728 RepID=UPI003F473E8D